MFLPMYKFFIFKNELKALKLTAVLNFLLLYHGQIPYSMKIYNVKINKIIV